jgi:hypothetical protein
MPIALEPVFKNTCAVARELREVAHMQFDADAPGDDKNAPNGGRQSPKSTLETELNQALERLDHQVEDTRNYLASLDKQQDFGLVRKRRKGDPKPNDGRER